MPYAGSLPQAGSAPTDPTAPDAHGRAV